MAIIVPTLKTPRLRLRPFAADDVGSLHEILGVDGMLRYFPRTTPPAEEVVRKDVLFQIDHWERFGYGRWVMTLPDDNRLIGWCGLQYLPDTDEIEIGYILEKPYWGQGLTTEAALAGQQWGFANVDLHILVAIIHPGNIASIRVAEKLGMTRTARTVYFGMDCFRYAISRPEYETKMRPAVG